MNNNYKISESSLDEICEITNSNSNTFKRLLIKTFLKLSLKIGIWIVLIAAMSYVAIKYLLIF